MRSVNEYAIAVIIAPSKEVARTAPMSLMHCALLTFSVDLEGVGVSAASPTSATRSFHDALSRAKDTFHPLVRL